MELEGSIKVIGETGTFGNSGFRKRELVIITNEQYPQTIAIEFVQDKCDVLNKYQVGQNVKIGINIRGREWTNPQGEVKYFNSIQGWKIESLSPVPVNKPPFEPVSEMSEDEQNDLPWQ